MEAYKTWVRRNKQWLSTIESLASSLTWFIPERFAQSELAPEAVSALVGVISAVNAHIIATAPPGPPPLARPGPLAGPPGVHLAQRPPGQQQQQQQLPGCPPSPGPRECGMDWAVLLLAVVKELEVLGEMAAVHVFGGEENKWSSVASIEILKALIRLMLVRHGGQWHMLEEHSSCMHAGEDGEVPGDPWKGRGPAGPTGPSPWGPNSSVSALMPGQIVGPAAVVASGVSMGWPPPPLPQPPGSFPPPPWAGHGPGPGPYPPAPFPTPPLPCPPPQLRPGAPAWVPPTTGFWGRDSSQSGPQTPCEGTSPAPLPPLPPAAAGGQLLRDELAEANVPQLGSSVPCEWEDAKEREGGNRDDTSSGTCPTGVSSSAVLSPTNINGESVGLPGAGGFPPAGVPNSKNRALQAFTRFQGRLGASPAASSLSSSPAGSFPSSLDSRASGGEAFQPAAPRHHAPFSQAEAHPHAAGGPGPWHPMPPMQHPGVVYPGHPIWGPQGYLEGTPKARHEWCGTSSGQQCQQPLQGREAGRQQHPEEWHEVVPRPIQNGAGTKPEMAWQAAFVLGELMHILRPVAYTLALRRWGRSSWKPWLLSLGLDATSLTLTHCYLRKRYPGRWQTDAAAGAPSQQQHQHHHQRQPFNARPSGPAWATAQARQGQRRGKAEETREGDQELAELRRRKWQLVLYLLRSPCFDVATKPPLEAIRSRLGYIPLLGSLTERAWEMLLGIQSFYFYTAAS